MVQKAALFISIKAKSSIISVGFSALSVHSESKGGECGVDVDCSDSRF